MRYNKLKSLLLVVILGVFVTSCARLEVNESGAQTPSKPQSGWVDGEEQVSLTVEDLELLLIEATKE